MHVKNLLTRRLPIGENQIHPFTWDAADSYRGGQFLSDYENSGEFLRVHVGNINTMLFGDHQNVPGIHRMDIHKRDGCRILIHHAGRGVPFYYSTKHTIGHRTVSQP